MASTSSRVLMYSHDTFGLGHLTRTLRIADAIQRRYPNTSILVLSGLSVAPYLPLPPRTDLVKIPSVLKSGVDWYQSRDLKIEFRQVRSMRRAVIRSTAETFEPDVFLVDNVPLGMKREIVPALEHLKGRAQIVLNLRDILDEGRVIRDHWKESGAREAIRDLYDAVHIFGDETVYDAVAEYELPAETSRQLGYVTPKPRTPGHSKAAKSSKPRVLVTAGGGGDGFPLFHASLEAFDDLGRRGRDLEMEIVTGPLMEESERRKLGTLAASTGARLVEFVPDLPARMERSDLVLAMAGYNTCCEILSCASSALLYPRSVPRVEQKIRAEAFARLGLAAALPVGTPDPSTIRDRVERILERNEILDEANLPQTNGQARAAEALAPWLDKSAHRPESGDRADEAERDPSSLSAPDSTLLREESVLSKTRNLGGFSLWPNAATS